MAKTRTMVEINNDYKVCRNYVDTHPTVASLKEIANAVGLSESQVCTSLSRHPRVFNNIKKIIEDNQALAKEQRLAEAEAKRKAKREADEAKKKIEAEARAKKKAERESLKLQKMSRQNPSKSENKNESEEASESPNIEVEETSTFVIDASITGADDIMDTINNLCANNSKIVLTSVTIKELERMQEFHDLEGKDARKILAMAAGDYEHFECVLIDETLGTPDDCIIKYCTDNKDRVILMTSDKTMELKSRAYGIKTNFFKQPIKPSFVPPIHPQKKIVTLFETRRIGGKLIISELDSCFKSIRVISNGIEYNEGTVELKVGDDIYIAALKRNYIIFIHYKVLSLSLTNNCRLIYSRRIYNADGISDLPEADYKSFVRDFKRKVDF